MTGYSSREIGQCILDFQNKGKDPSQLTPQFIATYLNEISEGVVGHTTPDEVRIQAHDDPRVAWVKTHPNWQKKAFDAEAEVKRRAATAAAAKVPHVAAQRVPEFAILPADHMIDGREGDSHSFSSYELEKYRWLCIVQHAILMAKEAGKKCTCPSVVITNDFAVRKDVERVLKAAKYGVMVVIGGREDDTTGGSCVIFRISWR